MIKTGCCCIYLYPALVSDDLFCLDCQLNPGEQVLSDRIKRKVWETKFAHRYISATFGSEVKLQI